MRPRAIAQLATPSGQAAVGVIRIEGDIDWALTRLNLGSVPIGGIALRRVLDVDECVLARAQDRTLFITPHGGPRILRSLLGSMESRGVAMRDAHDPSSAYPEAADELEARALATLARAASPLAIDLLLDQPRRWRAWDGASPPLDAIGRASRILNRLIDPPTVAMVGRANVGKSTLTNALAQRAVSIVAEEAGATRDHVGVTLDLAGVVIRWIDTAGMDSLDETAPPARAAIEAADALVVAGDAISGFPDLSGLTRGAADRPVMRVRTRADLVDPAEEAIARLDVVTAAGAPDGPSGLSALAQAVRDALVPPAALTFPGPWRFDPALGSDVAGAEGDS